MAMNFVGCDRDQVLLMPPSLREWVPEDHLVWTGARRRRGGGSRRFLCELSRRRPWPAGLRANELSGHAVVEDGHRLRQGPQEVLGGGRLAGRERAAADGAADQSLELGADDYAAACDQRTQAASARAVPSDMLHYLSRSRLGD
jgi:hypothetical protein